MRNIVKEIEKEFLVEALSAQSMGALRFMSSTIDAVDMNALGEAESAHVGATIRNAALLLKKIAMDSAKLRSNGANAEKANERAFELNNPRYKAIFNV